MSDRERFWRWGKILGSFFTAQGLAQLLSMLAGFVFMRNMAVEDYALYTLAFSFITFFNFATDLGSTGSLVHFFRHCKQLGEDFAPYVGGVLALRRLAFVAGGVAVVVAFPWLATNRGFALGGASLATAAIVVTVAFQLTAAIQLLELRLHGRYGHSYRAEIGGGGVRLVMALILVAVAFLPAWAALLSGALGTGTVAWLSRPEGRIRLPAGDLRPFQRRVLRYLLPTLPSALYFSVQGPLVVWLAASFGNTRNIAEVGAVGRLGLLVGLFSSLVGAVFLPHLAGITDDRQYLRRFFQFGSLLAAFATCLLLLSWWLPQPFLFLLGANYSGLDNELLLVMAGAGLSLLDGYVVGVNFARAWTRWQTAMLVTQIGAQALLVALLPLSSTRGVLLFNLCTAAVALLLQCATLTLGFLRPRWVTWS